ncbi:hypothetical protein [Candidatus Methylobacter favarea]|nr:hypothetical protein [Candidatus Methylobacter favarea]
MKLFKDYLLLCWFKNNPADLYPSQSFLWACVVFYLVSGIIVEGLISDPADGTLEVSMRVIVALSLIAMLVFFTKKRSHFKQLLTAVFMCENFIITLGIGAEILDIFAQRTEYEDYPLYLGVMLIGWYLAIISYILRRMFCFGKGVCFGLAFCYFCLTYGAPFLFMEVI